jgi:hypothetical protein
VYLPSALDARSAFVLFADPAALRARVTRAMFAPGPDDPEPAQPAAEPAPIETSLQAFEVRFTRASLDPRYRGMYLGRPLAAYHERASAMTAEEGDTSPEGIRARLEALYPATLREVLAKLRECREEEVLLEGLADGVLTAPGGLIRHRGEDIRRADLPSVIARVRGERRALEAELVVHDVSSRAAHRDAARALGRGWGPYLDHLLALLHFATHAARKLDDARSYLSHVVDIVLADGHVSSAERRRLLEAANDLHAVLAPVYAARDELAPSEAVAARFTARGGCSALDQKLGVGQPTPESLGEWLEVADGWARGAVDDLHVLAEATLDELLEAERHIARSFLDGEDVGQAPEQGTVPGAYPDCVIGAERPRQKRLGAWDRFQVADGLFPGLARFGVASGVLLPAIFFGGTVGTATIHAHNALGAPVEVTIDGQTEEIAPYETAIFRADEQGSLHVRTTTLDGKVIEVFDTPEVDGFGDYVYNVARAAPLVHWTATYGPVPVPDDRPMGAPRWLESDEEVIFEDPPESISTSGDRGTRTVLSAVSGPGIMPSSTLSLAGDQADQEALVEAHIAWEPSGSDALVAWADAVDPDSPVFTRLVARAEEEPDDVALQVIVLGAATGEVRDARCERLRARASAEPGDPDRTYLAHRCIDERAARQAAYLASYAQHPRHPWLASAAASALAARGDWSESFRAWDVALAGVRAPTIAASFAMEAIRTRRAAAAAGLVIDGVWRAPESARSGAVSIIEALEGEDVADAPPVVVAFKRLAAGDLRGALASTTAGEPVARQVLALAGASDGADPALRRRALALPVDDFDLSAVAALAALAVREGGDAERFFAAIDEALAPEPIAGLREVLASPDLATSPERLEALAAGQSLRVAAILKAMGVIVLGDRAPAAWRRDAKAALFPFERPFFR